MLFRAMMNRYITKKPVHSQLHAGLEQHYGGTRLVTHAVRRSTENRKRLAIVVKQVVVPEAIFLVEQVVGAAYDYIRRVSVAGGACSLIAGEEAAISDVVLETAEGVTFEEAVDARFDNSSEVVWVNPAVFASLGSS